MEDYEPFTEQPELRAAQGKVAMTESIQFIFALGILVGFAKLMGYLSYRLNQPAVLGELLAGLIIGPTLLNLLGNPALFPDGPSVQHTLIELAEIGVLLLMFMAGMEVDPQNMARVGRPAFLAGAVGVAVPLLVITPVVTLFGYPVEKALFIGILLASMSTSISAQVMFELGVIRRREGLTLLGAALIDDAIVILLLSLFMAINPGGIVAVDENSRSVAEVIIRIVGFLTIGTFLSWVFLPRLTNLIHRLPIAEGALAFAIVATLVLAFASEAVGGIAGITGAFLAGVCIRRAQHGTVEAIERGIHAVNYGLLVPLFFISMGLRADLGLLAGQIIPFTLVITVLAIITKVTGAGLGSLLGGFDRRGALRVGIGMISRGEVGLIIASVGVSYGILVPEVFTAIVFVVLVTTLITPPLIRWSFRDTSPATTAGATAEETTAPV